MSTTSSARNGAPMIAGRYALLTHIPVYLFDDGTVRTAPLWEKDLSLHFDYLDLHLVCPVLSQDAAGAQSLAVVAGLDRTRVHPVAQNIGWGGALKNLGSHFLAMGRVARDNDIVQGGAAGWPFPLSFYLLFWRLFYRFKWVMVVESSFWRLEPGERGSLRKRIAHVSHMALVPLSLRLSDARIFTQDEYRRSLLGETDNTLVSPAVWYDAEHIETPEGLAARHAEARTRPARVIFPARMVAEKGVDTVIEGVRQLEARLPEDQTLEFDFIGQGDLAAECQAFAATHEGRVRVRYLEPVPYGAAFFRLMRGYDALIVANRKAEQARIILDGFSQGVAPIASRTSGTLDIIRPGIDAETFAVDDAVGLADQLAALAQNPEHARRLGAAGLAVAQNFTHREMHRIRRDFLLEVL